MWHPFEWQNKGSSTLLIVLYNGKGDAVAPWLVLPPHSKTVVGSILRPFWLSTPPAVLQLTKKTYMSAKSASERLTPPSPPNSRDLLQHPTQCWVRDKLVVLKWWSFVTHHCPVISWGTNASWPLAFQADVVSLQNGNVTFIFNT